MAKVEQEARMPRKLVAFPTDDLAWAQALADEQYPSVVAGQPGNTSAVIRDALAYYRKHKEA